MLGGIRPRTNQCFLELGFFHAAASSLSCDFWSRRSRASPPCRDGPLSCLVFDELLHRYLKVRHLGRGSIDHVSHGCEGGGQIVDLR